jgi:hypothetical protein
VLAIKLQVGNRCQLQVARFYRGPHAPRNAPEVSTPTSKPDRPHIDHQLNRNLNITYMKSRKPFLALQKY